MVFIGVNGCLYRHRSTWTKFRLKPSILDPNRDIYMNWAHGAHGLLGWGTTRRELKVPSGLAPRNPGDGSKYSFLADVCFLLYHWATTWHYNHFGHPAQPAPGSNPWPTTWHNNHLDHPAQPPPGNTHWATTWHYNHWDHPAQPAPGSNHWANPGTNDHLIFCWYFTKCCWYKSCVDVCCIFYIDRYGFIVLSSSSVLNDLPSTNYVVIELQCIPHPVCNACMQAWLGDAVSPNVRPPTCKQQIVCYTPSRGW